MIQFVMIVLVSNFEWLTTMMQISRKINQKEFENQIIRQLIGWSNLSIVVGLLLLVFRRHFLHGVGIQFLTWGGINGAIGWFAIRRTNKPSDSTNRIPDIENPLQKRKLVNFLRLNALLDIFYIMFGIQLMQTKGKSKQYWLGQGLGIVLQGLFLLLFDSYHSFRLLR